MGQTTNVSWCDSTWNIGRGCDPVSEGCTFCYMMRDSLDGTRYNPNIVTRTTTVFDAPLKWHRQLLKLRQKSFDNLIGLGNYTHKDYLRLEKLNKIKKIFTSSLTDFLHQDIDSYRNEVWGIIKECSEFNFLMLTKRIERAKDQLPADLATTYKNVWLGVTAENQDRLNERGKLLLEIPATVRFLSLEPLLGPINLKDSEGNIKYDWVIIGGESGNENGKWRYRKSRLEWYVDVVRQCNEAGVPVFVKQLGTWLSKELRLSDRHGTDINEFPEELRVREFPKEKA